MITPPNCLQEVIELVNKDASRDIRMQAHRNCICGAESLMVQMLRKLVGRVDQVDYADFAFRFESWKEEAENL
jgi:hypothetical protein